MSSARAGTSRWSWAKGCVLVGIPLLALLLLLAGWVVTTRPLLEAIEVREVLDERYGTQEGFTPSADGAISPARMEVFLAVRQRLTEPCARLAESQAAIDALERFEWVEPAGLLGSLWRRGRSAVELEMRRAEYLRARNQALLDVGMGLGEYSYLFVLAHGSDLASRRGADGPGAIAAVGVLPRIRQFLGESLHRQLAAVDEKPPSAESRAWKATLTAEIGRLEGDPRRIPWMEGLPAQIAPSIDPYRERLDALRCEAVLSLELIRNEKQGLSIHSH